MKNYNKVFAVRNKETGKLISKNNSNPFYVRIKNAEDLKQYYEIYRNKEGMLEIVTFNLVEEGNE